MGMKRNVYEGADNVRKRHVDRVVCSAAEKKVVVGGPGTGKTHLFRRILEGKGKALTLTFVNALVEDLSLKLCGVSDVKTLHGFARGVLKKATGKKVRIFPKLAKVIERDAKILLNEEVDFEYIFYNRDDQSKYIEFYKRRKDYYGYYGFADLVFEVVKYFEEDKRRIPRFEQVIVDEFQDFNALEVSLVDLLAERSPVLLAGDDDQALYESLTSASPEHIRQRHRNRRFGYSTFCLPYCSRCTRVIVEATNDIIGGALADGYLTSRIDKQFQYFGDQRRDGISDENPKIVYTQLFASQIPWFIEKSIGEIAKQVRDKFTVLVICPTKRQCRVIKESLKNRGFQNIHFMEKKPGEEPTLLDGLKLVMEDNGCNLGWRVVAKHLLKPDEFEMILRKSGRGDATRFWELLEVAQRKQVREMVRILRAVRDGKEAEEPALGAFLERIGFDVLGTARNCLRDEIKSEARRMSNVGVGKTSITVTTRQSSKGLQADYVFIAYFDDKYFRKDSGKVSDEDIRNLIVCLTRARRKVFLISSEAGGKPMFLKWIDTRHVEQISVRRESRGAEGED
jgi:superfamily I DNA/RNA helicase